MRIPTLSRLINDGGLKHFYLRYMWRIKCFTLYDYILLNTPVTVPKSLLAWIDVCFFFDRNSRMFFFTLYELTRSKSSI